MLEEYLGRSWLLCRDDNNDDNGNNGDNGDNGDWDTDTETEE